MIGKRFRSLPFIFANDNYTLRSRNFTGQFHIEVSGTDLLVQFFCKPSAFESEIHPSHKSPICTLGISPLQGAKSRLRDLYKCCRI